MHSQATLLQATGFQMPGFPGMGCWVSYGLGSMNDNLPAFVVLPDHRGFASNGTKNWDAAFLPSQHSGTVIAPSHDPPIFDLRPDRRAQVSDGRERSGHARAARAIERRARVAAAWRPAAGSPHSQLRIGRADATGGA